MLGPYLNRTVTRTTNFAIRASIIVHGREVVANAIFTRIGILVEMSRAAHRITGTLALPVLSLVGA
jgi:hypothetical protein